MTVQKTNPKNATSVLTILLIGAVAAIMNQTTLNVAIPSLTGEFNVSTSTAQWLITLYMLVNGIVVPTTAFLMDRFSTRQFFFASMVIFSIGTFLCGIAPNFTILLIGRVIQAFGAGVTMPLLVSVVFKLYPAERRGAVMGVVGIAIMFAPAIGPPLAGFLITQFSWRFIFYAILPFPLIAIFAAYFFLKNVSEAKPAKLDVIGVITSSFGFGGILYAFGIAGVQGWGSNSVFVSLLIGILSLTLFVIRQLTTDHPLIDLKIFKSIEYTLSIIINFFVLGVTFSAMILIPIYLQDNRGMTALESGLFLLPGSIAMVIMSPIAGRILDRHGVKGVGIFGTITLVIATAAYTNLTYSSSVMFLVFIYGIRSIALTFLTMPMMTAGLNSLPNKLHSHGTAMHNTISPIAGAIGTAIMTTVMTTRANKFVMSETGMPTSESLSSDSLLYGINSAFLIATIFAIISLAAMIVLVVILTRKNVVDNQI